MRIIVQNQRAVLYHQIQEVLSHKWMKVDDNSIPLYTLDSQPCVDCTPLIDEDEADPDVLSSMSSLGCFRDRVKLMNNLMSKE